MSRASPGTPASSYKFSRAGLEFLSKFSALAGSNKKLKAANADLSDVLVSEQRLSAPDGEVSTGNPRQTAAEQFDIFCQYLAAVGIKAEKADAPRALEELFLNVQNQEVQICQEGDRLLQRYSVLRVHLLANIAGTDQCLIEHDRFNLVSGQQTVLMTPLEVRMCRGETWQQAARRGLQMMVGLEGVWQDDYIAWDESSYICTQDEPCQNTQGFFVAEESHEVHARLKADKESDDMFEQIGLPSGRDFVYCNPVNSAVHVWCWKSREYEFSAGLKIFEKHLADHGVDTTKFGVDGNRTIFQLYHEAEELKDCSILETTPSKCDGIRLQRVVHILEIKLIAEVSRRRRVLTELKREADQCDVCGRKASVAAQRIVVRLREGEDWEAALPLTIAERFLISEDVQGDCFTIEEDKMAYTEEVVESSDPSQGFAGIQSLYKIRTVVVCVTEPDDDAFEIIGLPHGNDFVTKEYNSCGAPDMHVWTWSMAHDEEDDEEGVAEFNGTALELMNRGLYDVENMLTQTISDPRLVSYGLDKPFIASLQKLKQCVERLSNIDKTVKEVSVTDIMGEREVKSGSKTPANSELQNFIQSNFIRAEQPEGQDRAPQRMGSIGLSLETLKDEHGHVSLENIFGSAPPVLQSIMESRNEWEFNLFDLSSKCENPEQMLVSYGQVMVAPFCVNAYDCTEQAAMEFVHTVASQYLDNPYHGHVHAAQVCHLARWLTKAMRIMELQSELESTTFMVASLCHDVKHIGFNNSFCVQTENPLALLYGNMSVLENFHASTCLQLLESMKVLSKLSAKDRGLVRSHVIENILATDMVEHFETISKFRVRWESQDFSLEVEADRRFVARLCLKAGDLGHGCLPWEIHTQWCTRVMKEFYTQGDEEQRMGLPMSALCDRKDLCNLQKSQKGFLEFVVSPLYKVLVESQTALIEAEEAKREAEREAKDGPRKDSCLGIDHLHSTTQRRRNSAQRISTQQERKVSLAPIEKRIEGSRRISAAKEGKAVRKISVSAVRRTSSDGEGRRISSNKRRNSLGLQVQFHIEMSCSSVMQANSWRWVDDVKYVDGIKAELGLVVERVVDDNKSDSFGSDDDD